MAPAKSASAFAAKNEDGLDRAAAWERAAQILDLSADLTRRLRTPELECVSRHEVRGSPASLYLAKMFSSCEGTLLRVELGAKCSASRAVSEARELEVQAALAGCPWAAAAAGLQIATGTSNEQEVWELARECAPIVAKLASAEVQLLPDHALSSAFARWTSEIGAHSGSRLRMPPVPPMEYCDGLEARRTDVIVFLSELTLEGINKRVKEATVSIIGTDRVACGCLQRLHEAGAQVVAVADESGAVLDTKGLGVTDILRHVGSGGLLAEFAGARHGLRADALGVKSDLLLLCSGEAISSSIQSLKSASRVIVDVLGNNVGGESDDGPESIVIDSCVLGAALLVSELGERRRNVYLSPNPWKAAVRQMWENISNVAGRYRLSFQMASLVVALQRMARRERSSHP